MWKPKLTGCARILDPVPRTAAFFDLDKTIIAKSSTLAFGRPFYQSGLINRRTVLRSAYAQFVFALAGALSNNFRTALLLVSLPVFAGALVFLRARDHFDRDAAKILEAVARALQEQQLAVTSRPAAARAGEDRSGLG